MEPTGRARLGRTSFFLYQSFASHVVGGPAKEYERAS
jgi:hypothetical protein